MINLANPNDPTWQVGAQKEAWSQSTLECLVETILISCAQYIMSIEKAIIFTSLSVSLK